MTYSPAKFKWPVSKTQGFNLESRGREEVLSEKRMWVGWGGEYIRRRASKSRKFNHRPTIPFSQRCHHFLETSYHYSFFLPFLPLSSLMWKGCERDKLGVMRTVIRHIASYEVEVERKENSALKPSQLLNHKIPDLGITISLLFPIFPYFSVFFSMVLILDNFGHFFPFPSFILVSSVSNHCCWKFN